MKHFPLPRPETSSGDTALMARQSPRARNPLRDNVFYDKQIQTLIIPLQTLLLIKHLFCDLLLFSLPSSRIKFCWLKMKLTSTINVLKISKLSLTNRLSCGVTLDLSSPQFATNCWNWISKMQHFFSEMQPPPEMSIHTFSFKF